MQVTVNITQRSYQELVRINQNTSLSKTDIINRAMQIYGLIEDLLDRGGGVLHLTHTDGAQEHIYIL